MKLSLALHLIGIVFWTGSLLLLTRFLLLATDSAAPVGEPFVQLIKRCFFGFSLSGLVIALISGLYQIFEGGGFAAYMKQGWFHGKLTFLIVLFVVTAITFVQVKRLSAGEVLSRKTIGMLHGLTSLSLLVIVLLTMLGR